MAVRTQFTEHDFNAILEHYNLGRLVQFHAVGQGTVQTTYLIETTQGTFVFRYYENRALASVLFERDLLAFLQDHYYPCPRQIKDKQGSEVGLYCGKPYAISEYIYGRPIENPSSTHWCQMIQKAAELQSLTLGFRSRYLSERWNYDPDLCLRLAREEALRINTADASAKLIWLENELSSLDLPASVPRGICHGDFHFSNVLFNGDELAALIDFDDANHTYLTFDLVGLIEYRAWPHTKSLLDLTTASWVVQEYMKQRPLAEMERHHLVDVYKLSILFDCVWYFERGTAADFRERRKIEALNHLGRRNFFAALFPTK